MPGTYTDIFNTDINYNLNIIGQTGAIIDGENNTFNYLLNIGSNTNVKIHNVEIKNINATNLIKTMDNAASIIDIINCTVKDVNVSSFLVNKKFNIINSTFSNVYRPSTEGLLSGTVPNVSFINTILNSTFINCNYIVYFGYQMSTSISYSTFINCNQVIRFVNTRSDVKDRVVYNSFINSTLYYHSNVNYSNTVHHNWFGINNPTGYVNNGRDKYSGYPLKVGIDIKYNDLIDDEWNSVIDVYFIDSDGERINININRPLTITVNSGENFTIKDAFTNKIGKIFTTNTPQNINLSFKVDNQELGTYVFNSQENVHSLSQLNHLISGYVNDTLVLNNNYFYQSVYDEDFTGIDVNNDVIINGNSKTVSGSGITKNLFNISNDNVVLENITIADVNGTGIISYANNTQINNLQADNINGSVIDIQADNAVISNIVADGGEGFTVSIEGNYPTVRSISATNREGELLFINGKGASDNLNITIGNVTYPNIAQANVTASVDGNYTIIVNDKRYNIIVSDGKGTIFLDVLDANEYTATIENDMSTYEIIASTKFTVNNDTIENLTVSADTVSCLENATVTITSNVDGNYTVTVNNEDYPVIVSNGEGNIVLPKLPVGTYNLIVSGLIKNYNPINKTIILTVKDDINVNITIPEIVKNKTTEIPINLPSDATGNVSVIVDDELVDSQELINGSAILEIPPLSEGEHNITVIYTGDDKYAGINQTSDVPVKVDCDLNITMPKVYENKTAELPVTLPSDAAGNVSVIVDGEVADSQELVNGSAILEIPALSKGEHNITVIYSGDDKYASQIGDYNVTVVDDLIISSNNLTKYYSAPDRFIITVTDSKGNPFVNKTVTITLNGKNYTRHTDENGSANLAINLNPGEYDAIVTADNVTFNHTITVLSTINGTDVVKVFRNGTQYYVTLKDNNGNLLPEGSEVEFNINGVIYTHKTDENGTAKLNINLDQGNYIITTTNLNTSESRSNNITVLSRFTNNTDIVKYYKNGTQYSVTLLGDDGNPVGAGVDVVFNINGVLYTRQTNDEGVAKLNINLQPGNYIITAMDYYDCRVSNNIEVLPTLVGEDLVKNYGDSSQFVATVYDNTGNAYPNQNVTFNINGVFYNTRSDSNGQAKLNINLPKGEYIITSSYNDYNVANKITIH